MADNNPATDAPAVENKKQQGKKNKKQYPKKDKPQQATKPIKPAGPISKELDPPRAKEANDRSQNKPVTNESLVSESVFAVDSGFHPAQREIGFIPSSTGWTSTMDDAYAELRNDKNIQVSKELPIEAFRYYASSMYWLRAVSLKLWLGRELTDPEAQVQRTFEGKTFVLPDPIHLGLKAIGKVTTKNGEVLAPTIPDLPNAVTARTPGTLGVVATANHNVYEDFPVIGVAYQGCYERAQTTAGGAYVSVVAPEDQLANRNLQGFDSLKPVRQDALATLYAMGFEPDVRPPSTATTGLNYNALKTVSNLLAKTDTFKNVEVDIFSIPVTGSLAQIIETIPDPASIADTTRAASLDVTAQSYALGTTTQIGISEVFGLCAYKATSDATPWESWSSITWATAADVPEGFVANRNALRTLPTRFHDRVFYTAIINMEDQRKTVISRLARHKS